MATALRKVRGLGAAHRGPEIFWRQRVTALANIPLILFLILSLVTHIGADYATVHDYLARPAVAILMLCLVISAALHMRVGLGEIVGDYLHQDALKLIALMLATFFAWGVGLACALAILKISFGA